MRQETIIYYFPMKEQEGILCTAKKHWWQEVKLQGKEMAETDGLSILACPVPTFYYRKKNWKPQVLCEAMENVLYEAEGMTDTFLAPALKKYFPQEMEKRWRPRLDTIQQMTALQLAGQAAGYRKRPDRAVVWLGEAKDADWQMEMTWELLQPYLSRINQCIIWYEPIPGVDIREELDEFLEEYYYEYGLLVEMQSYGQERKTDTGKDNQLRRTGLLLDYRGDNLYRSSLKYLDTMVKNRYDKLV